MNADPANFYARLGSVIHREDSAQQHKEHLLALWEARSINPEANPRIVERGNGVAANLKGTPADCFRGHDLMADLRWLLSKLNEPHGLRTEHHADCKLLKATTCAAAVPCKHGYDICPMCDPCTCGTPSTRPVRSADALRATSTSNPPTT